MATNQQAQEAEIPHATTTRSQCTVGKQDSTCSFAPPGGTRVQKPTTSCSTTDPDPTSRPAPSTSTWAQEPAWPGRNAKTWDTHCRQRLNGIPVYATTPAGDTSQSIRTLLALSDPGNQLTDDSLS
ncbi:Hypothetical predicted protein [Pelobates cultripes]|uniref:Uncharacterized protein n=1 Tax=Pelobates cultripes TaxID=61616 RepID=A0AAD1VMJ5_PELCU|nr:Hypothetical predicted protein [Pelobates cultripes]